MTLASAIRTVGVLVGMALCSHARAFEGPRDGRWWLRADRDERIGYLAGYMDCGAYDAREPKLSRGSWYNLEPKIGNVYRNDPSKLSKSVASVLLELAPRESMAPGVPRGQKNPDKHGPFDGEYWRAIPLPHRVGFVQGYMDCWKNNALIGAKFTRPARAYVQQVSTWYETSDDDPGTIRADRAREKIADVLVRFAE